MAQQIKQAKAWDRLPAQILAVLLPVQIFTNVLGKAEEDDSSAWAPVTHMGNLDRVPDSWNFVWTGPGY